MDNFAGSCDYISMVGRVQEGSNHYKEILKEQFGVKQIYNVPFRVTCLICIFILVHNCNDTNSTQTMQLIRIAMQVCFFRAHLRFGRGAPSKFSFPSGKQAFFTCTVLPFTGIIAVLLLIVLK